MNVVLRAMERVWSSTFATHSKLSLEKVATFKEEAEEVRRVVVSQAIKEHPLAEIVKSGMKDVVEQADAFDLLAGRDTAIAHARSVEETVTILQFILKDPSRYNEFEWRWSSSATVHDIRNEHFNSKRPLDAKMAKWIANNSKQLKQYVKICGEPGVDEKGWVAFSNWLYKIQIKEMFEKTGRAASYSFRTYEWANHSTHFSPLGDRYAELWVYGRPYVEMWQDFIRQNIHSLLRILLPVVANQAVVRRAHAGSALRAYYQLLKRDPDRGVKVFEKNEGLQHVIGVLLSDASKYDLVETALLGKQGEDPLLLKL
ncbi:MAG: DUF5677 domain-containing protein [Myxococcaceae bacterium]